MTHNGEDTETIQGTEAGLGAGGKRATTSVEKGEEETGTGRGPGIDIDTTEIGDHGPTPGIDPERGTGDSRGQHVKHGRTHAGARTRRLHDR